VTTLKAKIPDTGTQVVSIKPSLTLLLLVLSIHLAALLALKLTNLTLWLIQLGWVLLFVNLAVYCYRWSNSHNLRLQKYSQYWKLIDEVDETQTKTIIRCYYWSRWLIILQVEQQEGSKQYFPLLPDMCEADKFHYLKIVSRFEMK